MVYVQNVKAFLQRVDFLCAFRPADLGASGLRAQSVTSEEMSTDPR